MQSKTQQPVQFELSEQTRDSVGAWITKARLHADQCLFPSRLTRSPHISTRQYARLVKSWKAQIGLDPAALWHPLTSSHQSHFDLPPDATSPGSATAAAHTKMESTVWYLGIEVDDALEMAEQTEV